MGISTIMINGVEYELIDKASRDALYKINEPYILTPAIKKDYIAEQNVATTITDGFEILNYEYFYFTSTNKNRVLYTKAGNMVLQNMVCFTEYLSNQIEDIEDGEVITIHYGN